MWWHDWLAERCREACIDEAILAPWTGKQNCAFDKDTPLLKFFTVLSICLATNQVISLYVEAGIHLSQKAKGCPEMSCCA